MDNILIMKSLQKYLVFFTILAFSLTSQAAEHWHTQPVRGIGVNMWAPAWYKDSIKDFDAEKLAKALDGANATVGFTFQGFTQDHDGMFFYPTVLGPKHPNLGDRDHIGEYVKAMHEKGLKVFAYYSFPDKYLAKKNPDWRQVDSQGNKMSAKRGALCPNSEYRDLVLKRVCEIVKKYPVDGLLIDSIKLFPDTCYCNYCQTKFKEQFGHNIPAGQKQYNQQWRNYLQWRYDHIGQLNDQIRVAVKNIRPELVYTHNAFAFWGREHWARGEDFEKIIRADDVVTSLAAYGGNIDGNQVRHIDRLWRIGLKTRFLRGLSEKPVWIQMGRFPYSRNYQVQPVNELKLAAYLVLANGGSPFYIDNISPEGRIDEIAYERMGEVFSEIKNKQEYLDYTEELPFAAVYYSRKSSDYYDLTDPGQGRYLASFEGTCKALVEGKIPFQIIGEAGFTEKN